MTAGREGSSGGETPWWRILGVSPDASPKEVKSAYRKLVKTRHPDLYQESEDIKWAQKEFGRVNAAYEQGRSASSQSIPNSQRTDENRGRARSRGNNADSEPIWVGGKPREHERWSQQPPTEPVTSPRGRTGPQPGVYSGSLRGGSVYPEYAEAFDPGFTSRQENPSKQEWTLEASYREFLLIMIWFIVACGGLTMFISLISSGQ